MKFEGDYLVREWTAVKPRLAAGETMEQINPIKVYRHRQVAQDIAARLGGRGSVLEVGCGASLVIQELSKLGIQCRGIDMDPLVLEYSAALSKSYGSGIELDQLDAFALPFPDKTFDLVFSVGMLEHYSPEDQLLLVKEQARVARRFVEIHVPNEGRDSCMWFLIKDHEDSHLPTDIAQLARDAGLVDLEVDGRGMFAPKKFAVNNSARYQEFVHARFPHLWKDFAQADIGELIASDRLATKDERMAFGSMHYVVGRVP